MIVVTGATGQLGGLVIDELLKTTEARDIIAAVRTPAKANGFAKRGIPVREADYSRPETLAAAFDGASRLLLISGNLKNHLISQFESVDLIHWDHIGDVFRTLPRWIGNVNTNLWAPAIKHLDGRDYLY